MKGWIRRTCVGCVVALALGGPLAHAEGGTIMFSGAVVAPTCSVDSRRIPEPPNGQRSSAVIRNFGCAGTTNTSFSALAPQAYTVSVEPLDASALRSDRLISYFSDYVHAAVPEEAHMQLVTQAYE